MGAANPLLMAVDAGTGSIRAVVFDTAGRQLAAVQREYSHPPVEGWPGGQTFEAAPNWELARACIREAITAASADASDIAAVATTAMREGMVLYDAEGTELWACPNSDSRASVETEELIRTGLAEEIYRTGGDWVAITAPARLRWLQAHDPELLSHVRHLTMLSDWLVYRLTEVFVTDPSIGSSTALFDLSQRSWSDTLVSKVGIPAQILPTVFEPGTVVGQVTPQAAAETGLTAGTPVVLGGADTQLALLGLGVTEPGSATVIGGTFWQTTILVDQALIDPEGKLRTLCHAVPEQWMVEGIGFWCGLAMRWLRDVLYRPEQGAHDDAWRQMNDGAVAIPRGSNGVTAILSRPMNTQRWLHATPGFLGIDVASPESTGAAAMVRATMEAAAYVVRAHVEQLEAATGRTIKELVFSGGAAKSELWSQIIADVTGRVVKVPAATESTALGAALCAGVGVGIWTDLQDAGQAVAGAQNTVNPDPVGVEQYDELFGDWQRLYDHQLAGVEQGLSQPMWAAAGVLPSR